MATTQHTRRSSQRRSAASRRRPAPRKHVRGDERRRQILNAAAELFAGRGFAGTTTRQIAAAVGTSETVLFRHFPTKHDLYEAILEHQLPVAGVGRWIDELRAMAERRDDEALFGAVVQATLDSFTRDLVYHRLMLFAALEGHELARIAHTRYTAPIVAFLKDYVALRQAEGAFRRARPELVIHALLSTAAYYGQSRALGMNATDVTEREIAEQAAMMLAGIKVGA